MLNQYGFRTGSRYIMPARGDFSTQTISEWVPKKHEMMVDSVSGNFVIGDGVTRISELEIAGKLPFLEKEPERAVTEDVPK